MARLVVRRTGNSLAIPLPSALVRALAVKEGDEVTVQIERVTDVIKLAGSLKGRITADQFTRLSNEGEDLG